MNVLKNSSRFDLKGMLYPPKNNNSYNESLINEPFYKVTVQRYSMLNGFSRFIPVTNGHNEYRDSMTNSWFLCWMFSTWEEYSNEHNIYMKDNPNWEVVLNWRRNLSSLACQRHTGGVSAVSTSEEWLQCRMVVFRGVLNNCSPDQLIEWIRRSKGNM